MFEQGNVDWDKPKQFMQILNLKKIHAVNLLQIVHRSIRLKSISATSLECKSNDWFLRSMSSTTLGGNELKSKFLTKFFTTQLTFTCTKSTIETLKEGVKYVQS